MISLTPQAAKRIRSMLDKRNNGIGIRIGVKTTGCSGLSYVLEFVDQPRVEDSVFANHGIDIYIDPKALPYVAGTTMDWVRQGLNEGFEFNNPNERDRCGCGESFRV